MTPGGRMNLLQDPTLACGNLSKQGLEGVFRDPTGVQQVDGSRLGGVAGIGTMENSLNRGAENPRSGTQSHNLVKEQLRDNPFNISLFS